MYSSVLLLRPINRPVYVYNTAFRFCASQSNLTDCYVVDVFYQSLELQAICQLQCTAPLDSPNNVLVIGYYAATLCLPAFMIP